MKKAIVRGFSMLVAACILFFCLSLIFPIKSSDKSIKIKNIQIENIGSVDYIEQPYDEKEIFIDYVYNNIRSGISYKEYKAFYLSGSVYDNYHITFELTNNTNYFLGLFYIEGCEVDGVVVKNALDNEEAVFIKPGETYFLEISAYVDRTKFPSATDELILNQIKSLQFSKLKNTRNIDIVIQSFVDSFYKNYVKLDKTRDG